MNRVPPVSRAESPDQGGMSHSIHISQFLEFGQQSSSNATFSRGLASRRIRPSDTAQGQHVLNRMKNHQLICGHVSTNGIREMKCTPPSPSSGRRTPILVALNRSPPNLFNLTTPISWCCTVVQSLSGDLTCTYTQTSRQDLHMMHCRGIST